MRYIAHKDILELRDLDEEDAKEIEAKIRLKLHSFRWKYRVVVVNGAGFSDGYNGYH